MNNLTGECNPENFPIIKTTWTDAQRRTVWTLICKARIGLKLELSPIIASAFVILQSYFKNTDECPYKLFVLMSAALFASCKASSSYRPIQMIYNELAKVCHAAPSALIRAIAGNDILANKIIDEEQIEEITHAEVDLLKSIDFDINFELPFKHFEVWKNKLKATYPNENFIRICNSVIIDICLIICSKFYLELPPEVAAAAATKDTLGDSIASEETSEWFESVKQKYGEDIFDLAIQSLVMEKEKTFQRPQQQTIKQRLMNDP